MSMALILGTRDRLVAASDSRAYNEARTAFSDTVQKIDLSPDCLFAASGFGGYARAAWHVTPPVAGESAKSRATRVLATMQTGLTAAVEPYDVLFCVFRFAGHTPDGHAFKVRVAPGQTRGDIIEQGAPDGVPYVMFFGWDDQPKKEDVIRRQILPTLLTAPEEAVMLMLARETIRTAAAASAKVGGPTHLAILDGDGARWV
jgi:hypothetical protein